ncbi:MAG TPA: GspH/FimT family pseudopilin [Casimicrobiaceae bacterium]|jgi:general secretion pathway protein H|nr:GspH/FimT family pseudopilin [Casimicrobiaceae bacterium]
MIACPRPSLRIRGFTMMELLVVLAIMGIIAAFAMPTFGGSGVSTSALRGAAREIAAGLRYARSEAVAKRHETFVAIDLAGRRFKVADDPVEHALPKDAEIKLFTAQSDLVNDSTGAIRFFPDGGSNGGRITVASGDRKFDIDVDWLTGRVSIAQ